MAEGLVSSLPERRRLTANVFGVQIGITTPIFDGGRIRSTIAANEARLDEAAAQYESVLLTAISEVDGNYQSYALLQTRVDRLASARDSAKEGRHRRRKRCIRRARSTCCPSCWPMDRL